MVHNHHNTCDRVKIKQQNSAFEVMSELVLDEPDPQPGSPSVSGSESTSLPVEALTFGILASTSCSDSSVPWKTIPGLRLSDLLPAIFSNAASVPEAFASASLSSEASTFFFQVTFNFCRVKFWLDFYSVCRDFRSGFHRGCRGGWFSGFSSCSV